MKTKKPFLHTKVYLLQTELDAIKGEMADAMQSANPSFIANGGVTINIRLAVDRFREWARRYVESVGE